MKNIFFYCILLIISISFSFGQTYITPHPYIPSDSSKNLIYCNTFQLAWSRMLDDLDPDGTKYHSNRDVSILSRAENPVKDINTADYFVYSNYITKETVKEMNKKLKKKFGNVFDKVSVPKPYGGKNEYMIWAFLYKNLQFKRQFEEIEDHGFFDAFGKRNSVKAFGIKDIDGNGKSPSKKHNKLLKQMEVYLVPGKSNQYLVNLKSKETGAQIILAKIPMDSSFDATINKAIEYSDLLQPARKYQIAEFKVPKLQISSKKEFESLIGIKISKWIITNALQWIDFQLNEKGAILKSKAHIRMYRSIESPVEEKAIHLLFDQPFLLMLKNRNADYPYFVVWVNNKDIMLQ
ncbi:MAG: hypothetical protein ACOCVX_04615 [Bacteroidales bacterium]